MELREVTDKSSLTNQLDISAEASVNGIAGSASAKMKYVSSVKIDEEQSNFAVLARVTNGSEYVIPTKQGVVDLKPEFARLAKRDLAGFYRQCGDSFVSARMGGAELSAVLSFHVYSVDEKKALSVSVHGSGWGSIDASGSVSQSMTKYSSTSQFSVSYHEAGGSGDPIPTDQAGLITKIHSLPELAKSAPKYLKIEITRYDSLHSWPSKRSDWLYNAYEVISSQYQRFSSLHESVVRMLQSPSEYVLDKGVTLSDLATLEGQLLARSQSVKKRARECIDSSGTNCTLSTEDQVSDYTFRVRMPIRRAACPACVALDNATQDAAVKLKAWRDAIKYYAAMAEALRINEKQKFWDAQTQNERLAANNAAALVSKLTAEYPEGLRSAIATEWIEIPARARCAEDELNTGCVNELEIQELKKQIIIH
jgi:hypothetical protein